MTIQTKSVVHRKVAALDFRESSYFLFQVLAVYGFQTASIQPMESIGSKTVASHLSAKHVSAAAMSFTGSSQA